LQGAAGAALRCGSPPSPSPSPHPLSSARESRIEDRDAWHAGTLVVQCVHRPRCSAEMLTPVVAVRSNSVQSADVQGGRPAGRQTDRQTDRQADGQAAEQPRGGGTARWLVSRPFPQALGKEVTSAFLSCKSQGSSVFFLCATRVRMTTVLLCYCATVLLCYCATVLLRCCNYYCAPYSSCLLFIISSHRIAEADPGSEGGAPSTVRK